MANITTRKVAGANEFKGIQPAISSGRAGGNLGVVATLVTATITVTDPEVKAGMDVYACVQSSGTDQWAVQKAVAQNGQIVVTLVNASASSSGGGASTVIAYVVR